MMDSIHRITQGRHFEMVILTLNTSRVFSPECCWLPWLTGDFLLLIARGRLIPPGPAEKTEREISSLAGLQDTQDSKVQ